MAAVLIVLFIAGAVGITIYLRSAMRAQDQELIDLQRDLAFREFLTKAHAKRKELKDREAWNQWVLSKGYTPCITCNGSGRAGGADCVRCSTFGVDPQTPRK